jgi:Flp pilus assembly protein TadG
MAKIRKPLVKFGFCRRGAAAVEFALIAPLLIAIIFGIVIYGSYLAVVHGVQQLAAEVARASIAGLSESERVSLAQTYVTANVGAYPLISPNLLTVNATLSGTNVFVVTVSYNASQMFIYSLPAFVPAPPSNISRSAAQISDRRASTSALISWTPRRTWKPGSNAIRDVPYVQARVRACRIRQTLLQLSYLSKILSNWKRQHCR